MLASRLPHWKQALLIVKPDNVLSWHRCGFKLFWRHKSHGPTRQPRLDEETIALMKRMAMENRRWGAKRIRGKLLKLGLQVNRGTIRRYMRQARTTRGTPGGPRLGHLFRQPRAADLGLRLPTKL